MNHRLRNNVNNSTLEILKVCSRNKEKSCLYIPQEWHYHLDSINPTSQHVITPFMRYNEDVLKRNRSSSQSFHAKSNSSIHSNPGGNNQDLVAF